MTRSHHKWVPVTTAWRVLRLRIEERPPIWRVGANILNKQSRTAEKVRCSSFGLGELLTTAHRKSWPCYIRSGYMCLGPGLILRYDLNNGEKTGDLVQGNV